MKDTINPAGIAALLSALANDSCEGHYAVIGISTFTGVPMHAKKVPVPKSTEFMGSVLDILNLSQPSAHYIAYAVFHTVERDKEQLILKEDSDNRPGFFDNPTALELWVKRYGPEFAKFINGKDKFKVW